jgi:hypothetical protein
MAHRSHVAAAGVVGNSKIKLLTCQKHRDGVRGIQKGGRGVDVLQCGVRVLQVDAAPRR